MIDLNTVLKHLFEPEPVPSTVALKGYGNKYPEFKNFIAYFQTHEFGYSLLEGIFTLCYYNDAKRKNKELEIGVQMAFEYMLKKSLLRFNPNLKIKVNYSSTKTVLYALKNWNLNGEDLTIDLSYSKFNTEIDAAAFVFENMLRNARRIYQNFYIVKNVSGDKAGSPEEKDAFAFQRLVLKLYMEYQKQLEALYYLDIYPLNKSDEDGFMLLFMQAQKGSFLTYLRDKCSNVNSILFYFTRHIYDKMRFYESAIFIMNHFPENYSQEDKIKRLAEFIEMNDAQITAYSPELNGEKLVANLEMKGHALTELAHETKNHEYYYKAITAYWESLRHSKTAYKTKKISENLDSIGKAIGEDKMYYLSTLVHSIFTALPLFWAMVELNREQYEDAKDNYMYHYRNRVRPILDIKKIPHFYKGPAFHQEYSEKMKSKGAKGFIHDLVIGMILWLQYVKLVLPPTNRQLIDIEIDLYFVLSLEQEFYKDQLKNDEWARRVAKVKLENYQVNTLEGLLKRNQVL